jgi:hypothetical protein
MLRIDTHQVRKVFLLDLNQAAAKIKKGTDPEVSAFAEASPNFSGRLFFDWRRGWCAR